MPGDKKIGRRAFLTRSARFSIGVAAVAALPAVISACGDDDEVGAPVATASPDIVPGSSSPTPAQAQEQARVLVGDVVDFRLRNEEGWTWLGGWVVMKLHEAVFEGQPVYFVRTDSSDESFAEQEKLVYVPKLGGALTNGDHADLYLVANGTPEQRPVVSTAPGQADFTPLFRVSHVTWQGTPGLLTSHSQVSEQVAAGRLALEATDILVNYPVVKWPGGELPVDPRLEKALGGGPLVSAPDLASMTVKFKLHQCYPESYYIITDAGAAPMAGAMNVAAAPAAAALTSVGATEKIYVFGNGVPGFAAMGFQPSVFASKAGEPAWSPMWEHVTAMWEDGTEPGVLKSQAEVTSMADAGEIKLFPGTPDTNGESFVVNCPSPISAPNSF